MKLPKCLREEIKAMLKQLGFNKPHVSDEVLLNCWDVWRDRIKNKYPRPEMPIYGRKRRNGSSKTDDMVILCSAADLYKMMDDIDARIVEFMLLDGGYRER